MTLIRRKMTAEIALLEMKLILRNRAVRYLVITVPLIVTMLMVLLFNYPGPASHIAEMMFLTCLFVPVTYPSVAFSWAATNWASQFQLPVDPRDHLMGRFLVTVSLVVPPVVILTVFALWLRPEFALLPVAAGLFGATVITVPFLLVSAKTPKSLDANAPPLADTRKFGWRHWVASAVVVGPGIVVMRLIPFEQFVAVIGVLGVIGLAVVRLSLKYGAHALARLLPALSDRLLNA